MSDNEQLRRHVEKRVSQWFGEPVIAVEDEIMQLIKQARIDEIEAYADYLSDQDEEAAFEMAWQEYAYKRTRAIDNE